MEIIYQDNRIVVAIKPVGVLSTDEENGMPNLLRSALGTDCIRTVHRLDAQVSGLMVYARSAKAASLLSQQMRSHRFHKEYLAVIHGRPDQGRGTFRDLLGRDTLRRITYVADTTGKDVREAVLDYEVLDTCEGYSLVRICLHTGRTHQIRVQFASRGLPLVGDRKYGLPVDDSPIALWSHALSFDHPQTGAPVSFRQAPPQTTPWTWFSMEK